MALRLESVADIKKKGGTGSRSYTKHTGPNAGLVAEHQLPHDEKIDNDHKDYGNSVCNLWP